MTWLACLAAVLALSVPTIPAALLTGRLIQWRGWRPWGVVATGLAMLAIEVRVFGYGLIDLHFAGWVGHGRGLFDQGPGWTGRVLALWGARLASESLVGVPLGVTGGALLVARGEHQAAGAPWHPATQRREVRVAQAAHRRVTRTVKRADDSRCTGPALGVVRGGHRGGQQLREWTQHGYVVLPEAVAGQAILIAGAPGVGKTEFLIRLAFDSGHRGQKLVLADCKGSDPDLASRVLAAYRAGQGTGAEPIRFIRWPDQALDMWKGEPDQVRGRLMELKDHSVPWWTDVADTCLRLALEAPGEPRCVSSRELLHRLDPDWLGERWRGQPEELDLAAARANHGVESVHLRLASLFASLKGAFDGANSFEDADVVFMNLPTLMDRRNAEAAIRVVIADYGHYALGRKPRRGEDSRLVVDEFSAVSGLASQMVHLPERLRDVRVSVCLASQSWQGLGDDWIARRLVGASSALVLFRLALPEPLLEAAGYIEVPERSWRLDEYGSTGAATVSMHKRPLLDAQQVRTAGVGQAWVVQPGRVLPMHVLQVPVATEVATEAFRAVVGVDRPTWVVDLPGWSSVGQEGAWERRGALPGSTRRELPAPPSGAPVPARPAGPGTRLHLQVAAAVREGDRVRALELARVAGVPVAELQALEAARRLARLPWLLRLLAGLATALAGMTRQTSAAIASNLWRVHP